MLKRAYGTDAIDAAEMAEALAAAGFTPAEAAPELKRHYPTETDTAAKMAALLAHAYRNLAPADLAGALAASPYGAPEAATVLRERYPAETDTAAKLAALILAAYANPPLSSAALIGILQAAGFNLLSAAGVVVPRFSTRPLNDLAVELVQAYRSAAPVPAMELGVSLAAAGVSSPTVLAPAVRAALPETTAAQMTLVLQISYEDGLAAALSLAEQNRQAGHSPAQTAAAIRQARPDMAANALAAVLISTFTPPPLSLQALAGALVSACGPAQITPGTVAQALQACTAPAAASATDIAKALVAAYTGSAALTAVQVARALKQAGYGREEAAVALPAAGFTPDESAAAVAAVYSATALSLAGGRGYLLVPSHDAYNFNGTGDFTLIARVKGRGGVLLLRQGSAAAHGAGFRMHITPEGILSISTADASGNSQTCATIRETPATDGNWHWVAATRRTEGGICTYALYVDGQLWPGFGPGAPPLDVTVTAPLYIGSPGHAAGADLGFDGLVQHVALWRTALSAGQIAAYTAPTGPAEHLVGYWPLTEGSADDLSGLRNAGTVQGGASWAEDR